MQVEREPLKEPSDVEDAIAPSLEDFHAVVEPLDKAVRLPTVEVEVVLDLVHLPIDRPKKARELSKPACTQPLVPGPPRALRSCGRLVIIDFEPGGILSWISRPRTADRHGGHGTPKETVMQEVTVAGFQVTRGPESWRGRTYAVLFRRP